MFLSKLLKYYVPQTWNPIIDEIPAEVLTVTKKTLAEVMGLADGYCGGRGGSMHLRDKAAGFYGSNAIVAGGIPLAIGAAFVSVLEDSEELFKILSSAFLTVLEKREKKSMNNMEMYSKILCQ